MGIPDQLSVLTKTVAQLATLEDLSDNVPDYAGRRIVEALEDRISELRGSFLAQRADFLKGVTRADRSEKLVLLIIEIVDSMGRVSREHWIDRLNEIVLGATDG